MEVGAVKQAFNNEIILLKKNLNQAKIQTIHKLTRKAKTFMEKKVPEPNKEKLKRKAESAVKEVLIIKKIKARDIARFIVTHTGKLNDFLNKPIVDNDKACARLLLHKALQEKYKHIREKFSEISIKDLFMSRQERRKIKKEARDKQKNKRKEKEKNKINKSDAIYVEGEWDVEINNDTSALAEDDTLASNDDLRLKMDKSDDESNSSGNEMNKSYPNNDKSDDHGDRIEIGDGSEAEQSSQSDESNEKVTNGVKSTSLVSKTNVSDMESSTDGSEEEEESKKLVTSKRKILAKKVKNLDSNIVEDDCKSNVELTKRKTDKKEELSKVIQGLNSNRAINKKDNATLDGTNKKLDKKTNINKNKNLKSKLENRNFHKESDEIPNAVTKIVDPFFITSTGENYMSLVEPRPPDEVKEVHRQGNRQYRRAVMFGHVPRAKPKRNFQPRDTNFKKQINSEMDSSKFKTNFDKKEGFNRKTDRSNNFKGTNFKDDTAVPEKLHPSWEAKKKQSGIKPFQGKKIVFDES